MKAKRGAPIVVPLGQILGELDGWQQVSTPFWKRGANPDEDDPTWYDLEIVGEDGTALAVARGVRYEGYNTLEATISLLRHAVGDAMAEEFTDRLVGLITEDWTAECIDRELRR